MKLPHFMARPHREADGSNPPIEISGKTRWTMSMTNFWVLISIIAAGILGWTDLKSDNRVRDMVVGEHTDQIISVTAKVRTVDMKLTETRELLIKISGQMDSLVKEQAHQGRQIDRLSPAPHGS